MAAHNWFDELSKRLAQGTVSRRGVLTRLSVALGGAGLALLRPRSAGAAAVIVSAGATIVSESCSPANGAIDPGETVTVSFCILNAGDMNTANLVGTLQATGGVTSPSGPQNYGVVVVGGPPVCRNFTFTAAGTCGGTITATLQFQDGATNLGTVTYTFTLGPAGGPCCGAAPACTITCPANITVSNDPNQCGAVVNYPAPTTMGTCGTVTCSPASGSFFPVGTTTVTCTTAAGPSCTFTVTVVDTQPPSITCPANIAVPVTPARANPMPGAVVNYPPPTASDNCPGVTTVCNPPSGSTFPFGTTTVTCTATDASGNTATCAFTVKVETGADLGMGKFARPDTGRPTAGTRLVYFLNAGNQGPAAAQNLAISDPLPPNTTFVSATPSAGGMCMSPAVGANGTVTCTWPGATAPGVPRQVTLVVEIAPATPVGTQLTNTATVSSNTPDPNPANNSASATVVVV